MYVIIYGVLAVLGVFTSSIQSGYVLDVYHYVSEVIQLMSQDIPSSSNSYETGTTTSID